MILIMNIEVPIYMNIWMKKISRHTNDTDDTMINYELWFIMRRKTPKPQDGVIIHRINICVI